MNVCSSRPQESIGVARLALASCMASLPQWSVSNRYEITYGRDHWPHLVQTRDKLINPIHLFTINWADSGPGFSWPDKYCVSRLPGFNCYVVTASQDCEEVHGCCDQAINYFITDESSSIPAQCGHIIERWWRTQFYEGSQSCWQYLFEEGLMDSKQAVEIASRVWQEQAED